MICCSCCSILIEQVLQTVIRCLEISDLQLEDIQAATALAVAVVDVIVLAALTIL